MHKGNIKLPDNNQLRRHLTDGMTPAQIAGRYGCTRETVRSRIVKAGLTDIVPATESGHVSKAPASTKLGIDILDQKIVFTREVTAGDLGGIARRSMSVPRISMYVAALQDAGRC